MDTKNEKPIKRIVNKGAWTAEEDQRLAEYVEIHGAKKWKSVAVKAGLNRCEKSCRLRWLNYLRPNINRGQFTDQEEDLIIRLHKLLGNRWSLIAGRIPGRTDNDIKNYWNSHLSKKIKQERLKNAIIQEPQSEITTGSVQETQTEITTEHAEENAEQNLKGSEDNKDTSFNVDDFFNFSNESSSNLEWISKFLELDGGGAGTDGFHQNGSAPFFGDFDELNVFHM